MTKIKLVDTGWSMIPEGDHTFKITETSYNAKFGKVEIKMVSQDGVAHTERFGLMNGNKVNEGAQKAFSFFVKNVMGNPGLDEIDPDDLDGRYFSATVVHVESDTLNEKTGKPFVNPRFEDIKPVQGFDDEDATDGEDAADDEDEWGF